MGNKQYSEDDVELVRAVLARMAPQFGYEVNVLGDNGAAVLLFDTVRHAASWYDLATGSGDELFPTRITGAMLSSEPIEGTGVTRVGRAAQVFISFEKPVAVHCDFTDGFMKWAIQTETENRQNGH